MALKLTLFPLLVLKLMGLFVFVLYLARKSGIIRYGSKDQEGKEGRSLHTDPIILFPKII